MIVRAEQLNIAPGFHRDVPDETYFGWKLLSNSLAGVYAKKSPAHAADYLRRGIPETDPMRLGSATHCLLVTPDRFDTHFAVGPCDDKRISQWKDWASQQDDGMKLLKPCEHAGAMNMVRAIRSHDAALELLDNRGAVEIGLVWDIPLKNDGQIVNVRAKGKADKITKLGDSLAIVDVKTTSDASESEFARSAGKYGYHRQAAMYSDALKTIMQAKGRPIKGVRYIFIVVESAPPYAVAVYELDSDSIEAGRASYLRAALIHHRCLATDTWPDYADFYSHAVGGIVSITTPKWA